LDGRVLIAVSNPDGEVSRDTDFNFEESDGMVNATYAGGPIKRGYLIGVRAGLHLEFRYVHLTIGGQTQSGASEDQIELMAGGRVRLRERWRWESQEGSGESVLEEISESRSEL
jgi:hypothetical protein